MTERSAPSSLRPSKALRAVREPASSFPVSFHGLGQPSRHGQVPELADAQKTSILVEEVRDYEFWLKDRSSTCSWKAVSQGMATRA